MEIGESNPTKPVRVMIYGVEGVGKSTLGAKSEKPIFITPEGGIDQLSDSQGKRLRYFKGVDTWDGIVNSVNYLLSEKHEYETAVLDSADWIEKLAHAKIIGTTGKSIITCNGGYGTGYRESENLHRALIEKLATLRDRRNMNIVVTAHAHVKDVKDPSMLEDYQAFEIKCHEFVSSLWREWVDALLFARFATFVKAADDNKKGRAMGDGTRVVYTVKQPAFQAKNRYGLPPEMQLTPKYWDTFMEHARKGIVVERPETAAEIIVDIKVLAGQAKLDDATGKKFGESLAEAGEDVKKLNAIRKRLKQITGGK